MGPIRVLHIVPDLRAAGVETFIMNMYRHIDREKVQFDFLVHYKTRAFYDDEVEKMGGRIFRIPVREGMSFPRYLIELNRFFKKHKEYKIIHGHMDSFGFFYSIIARLNGVKIRISHSHVAATEPTLKGFLKTVLNRFWKFSVSDYFACSKKAGCYMYGKNSKFTVINNAIDLSRFSFNENAAYSIKSELGIEDKYVIGHIGRFEPQKNHIFLLKIFKEILKKKSNAVLVLVSTGGLFEKIQKDAESMGIRDKVLFLGVRKDTERLYQAFDVFVMPSLFEGLPVTGIEAQACGVPCIFSTEVTQEVELLPTTQFMSLSESPSQWAAKVLELTQSKRIEERLPYLEKYNIKLEVKKLEEWYLEHA